MNTLEKILEEIKTLKAKQDSSNQDFKVGYISALSTVEGVISELKNDGGWIPVSERLPELEIKCDDSFIKRGVSKKVLVQTTKGQLFPAYCDKKEYKKDGWEDVIAWYTHGTGGRKMKVMSKVVVWQPLPEKYEEN